MSDDRRRLGSALMKMNAARCDRLTYRFDVAELDLAGLSREASKRAAEFYGDQTGWRITSMDVQDADGNDTRDVPLFIANVWTELS